MTDIAELVAGLDDPGKSDEGQDLAVVKARIQKMAHKIPNKPLGFYVSIKMEKVQKTETIKNDKGEDVELVVMTDNEASREQKANPKGFILAFGPTAYRGFAGHGDDGMCSGPEDWGLEVGDYVEFQSYDGILSAFDETETIRMVPDSNIISKLEAV